MPFVASERTDRRSRDSIMGFADSRAAAWWNLREMLEPQSGLDLALPPDDQLTADLLAPKWEDQAGAIRVEAKREIRKRLKRSTDAGDAVVQAFWTVTRATRAAPWIGHGTSRWSPARASVFGSRGA
jgi:hypothetical protein